MQCAALRHGITAGDIKTEMQCTLLNIRQCADFQPDIRYPRNAVLFSLFADNVRRTEGFTKLAPSAVLIHVKYEKNREDIGLFGIWRD